MSTNANRPRPNALVSVAVQSLTVDHGTDVAARYCLAMVDQPGRHGFDQAQTVAALVDALLLPVSL